MQDWTKFSIPSEPFRPARWIRYFRRNGDTTERALSEHFFSLARNALHHAIVAMELEEGDEVLVPAYICSVVTEAIEATGAAMTFYDVELDCTVDVDKLASRMTTRTKALLIVHYFGIPMQTAAIRALCDEKEVYLIEDCAHTVGGSHEGNAIGSVGDVTIFSWRKHLAINDGASLVINNPVLDRAPQLAPNSLSLNARAAKGLLDQAFKSGWAPGLKRAVEFVGKTLRGTRDAPAASDPQMTSSAPPTADAEPRSRNDDHFSQSMQDRRTTDLSKYLWSRTNLTGVSAARRQRYRAVLDGLAPFSMFRPLVDTLPQGASPWVVPLWVDGVPDAHLEFRKLGISASHWGDVRPPGISSTDFPNADRLFRDLIFIPCHQDLDEEHLEKIIAAGAKIAGKTNIARKT